MTKPTNDLTPDLIVLGKMLWGDQDDAIRFAEMVDPGVFQSKATRRLFILMSREAPKGFSPTTLVPIVNSEAPECKQLLDRLMGRLGTDTANENASLEHIVESATAWSTTTKFLKSLTVAQEALAMGESYDKTRSTLERHLTAIDLGVLSGKSYDDKTDMVRRVRDFLDGDQHGLPFGYVKLDKKVTPILTGNFVVIAGRPGTGKSTDLRNWARNWVKAGERVVYFSLEMSGEEKLPLFACMDANLDYTRFVRKQFGRDEKTRFYAALEWWQAADNFRVNERSDVTPEWLLRQMHRYRADGFDIIVIDHLHRVRYTANQKGEVRLAMAEFAKALKSWGVDHSARVIAGAQLTKGDKHEEPDDDMIREASQILDEADKIFLKWLPLVAGLRTGNGDFVPTIGADGRRILASDAQKGADLGLDPTRTFLKIGKQRVRQFDGFVALPFNAASGVIADLDDSHLALAS